MFMRVAFGTLTVYAWALSMFIDRRALEDFGAGNTLLYVATVAPAVLFIVLSLPHLLSPRYQRPAVVLAIFMVLVACIALPRGDFATALSVGSLCAMLIAIRHSTVTPNLALVNTLFFLSIAASAILRAYGVGYYGLIPGQTLDDDLAWRVSLFTHSVTPSWLFALIVLGMNWFHNRRASLRWPMVALALYFLVFSASRTGLIVFAICLLFLICTQLIQFSARPFYKLYIPCAVAGFVAALSASTVVTLVTSVDSTLLSAILFKSETGVTSETVSAIRPLLWATHMEIFLEHPWVGHGTFDLNDYAPEFEGVNSAGTEAFITGLFARTGLPAVLFAYFVYLLGVDAARRRDRLAYCLTILLAISSLAYGSYIVPYDFVFLSLFGALNYSPMQSVQLTRTNLSLSPTPILTTASPKPTASPTATL